MPETSHRYFTWTLFHGSFIDGILLLMYFPFGIALLLVRLILGFQTLLFATIIPNSVVLRFVLRAMFSILGIYCKEDCVSYKPERGVLISNCRSKIDYVAYKISNPSCLVPNIWQYPIFISWLLGLAYSEENQDSRTDNVQKYKHLVRNNKKQIVYVQPEYIPTNGAVGLLKFEKWPFELSSTVYLSSLTIRRILLPQLNLSYFGSNIFLELCLVLFCPLTIFTIKYLPRTTQLEDETHREFADRCQGVLASELNLHPLEFGFRELFPNIAGSRRTHLTRRAKMEDTVVVDKDLTTTFDGNSEKLSSSNSGDIRKRPIKVLSSAVTSQGETVKPSKTTTASSPGPAIDARMGPTAAAIDVAKHTLLMQVKAVLPDVPDWRILRELSRTDDVDIVITRILEDGVVEPEGDSGGDGDSLVQGPGECLSKNLIKITQMKMGASQFGRTSTVRHQSFQERKQELILKAREYYIAKHGL